MINQLFVAAFEIWWPMTAIQNNPLNLNFIPIYLGLILLFILFRFLILH